MRQIEFDGQSPHQRLRSLAAAEAIKEGKIRVPLTCSWCNGEGTIPLSDTQLGECLQCLSCGRLTTVHAAHALRKQKLKAIIISGIDIEAGP
jgi:hypothetical protein